MSRIQCRGSLTRAAVLLAFFTSKGADAHDFPPYPISQPGTPASDFITGVHYDRKNQAHAERKLSHVEAKLGRDAARGDAPAVEHDLWRIDHLKYRIAVDEWLIRKNLLLDPGYYPMRNDCVTMAVIADAARPSEDPGVYRHTQIQGPVTAPKIPIVILNSDPSGASFEYFINGIAYYSNGGSHRSLTVPPGSYLTYDGGKSIGKRQYLLSAGRYEFRSTAGGWAFYKLPDMP